MRPQSSTTEQLDGAGGAGHAAARERLARSRVLIAGVGALGSPVALQLAAAGVGALVLMDDDLVDSSNLHRQILHRASAIGTPKVVSAHDRLRRLYPEVVVEARRERLRPENAVECFAGVDFVVDATDGVAAKVLLNDSAVRTGRPYSHAGVLGFQGQTMTVLPGRTACFRCVFPEPPPADAVPTCQEAGIIGAVAGVIGSLQAAEAIRYLIGERPVFADRLLTYDALARRWRRVTLARNPRCPLCSSQPSAPRLDAVGDAGYGS